MKVESVEDPPEELQDAPQLGIVYGPWKKEEEIFPLLSEESNGKEAGEKPQKPITQATKCPLPVAPSTDQIYILPSPAAQSTPKAPTIKATPSLPMLKNFKRLVAIVQNFATTSKKMKMAAAHTTWHSGRFGCWFGFGAPKPRHL